MKHINQNKKFKTASFILLLVIVVFCLIVSLFFVICPIRYLNIVNLYANKYQLDSELVFSIINTESHFKKNSVSNKGAIGLMQIMPQTAIFIADELNYNEFEVEDLFNENINIEFGCFYLKYLFEKFEKTDDVICAYNAGETIVRSWLNDEIYSKNGELIKIPYVETKKYLDKVKFYYTIYNFMI